MFKNLEAEQARTQMNNSKMSEFLGISRASFEHKKQTGKFTCPQIAKMLKLFGCSFDYLFATTDDQQSA